MTLVAIVEDEATIADILDAYLRREGFDTRCLRTGTEAEAWLRTGRPDLVLLDLMLPGVDGLALCRGLRARSDVPIIMVTARVEEIDRLLGLELGADDYVCKPFSPREVVARVKAVLRRAHVARKAQPEDAAPALEVDEASMLVRLHGVRLDLTPTEFRLLHALARRPGQVLSRGILLDAVSDSRDSFDRSIDSHIKNLRRKLAAVEGEEASIHSIYGVGYRLDLS